MRLKTLFLLGVLAGAPFLHGGAAVTNVTYGSFFFSNSVVVINVGDTVVWTNGLGSHTVLGTGADPMCGGALLPCAHTFNTPGTYPYKCTMLNHAAFGMTGTVIVTLPAPAPARLTNATLLANGQFRFTVISTANLTNIIQASTNLSGPTDWISLKTVVPSTNTFIFTDTNTGGLPLRFYRVLEPQ